MSRCLTLQVRMDSRQALVDMNASFSPCGCITRATSSFSDFLNQAGNIRVDPQPAGQLDALLVRNVNPRRSCLTWFLSFEKMFFILLYFILNFFFGVVDASHGGKTRPDYFQVGKEEESPRHNKQEKEKPHEVKQTKVKQNGNERNRKTGRE